MSISIKDIASIVIDKFAEIVILSVLYYGVETIKSIGLDVLQQFESSYKSELLIDSRIEV